MIFDRLWRLEWRFARIKRAHKRNLEVLRKKKASSEEIAFAGHEASSDNTNFRDEVESANTTHLVRRANRLGLPIPAVSLDGNDDNEAWVRSYNGSYYLSRTTQLDLRRQIRLEEKESRESFAFWVKDVLVPLLSVLLGMIGAATGLIAILRK